MTPTHNVKPTSYAGYFAGEDGKIYSTHKWRGKEELRQLTDISNGVGYQKVRLQTPKGRRNIPVHRVVASAWLPPRPSLDHELRHIDGNPLNNIPTNLIWGTTQENADDRARHGRTSLGYRHSQAVKGGLKHRHLLARFDEVPHTCTDATCPGMVNLRKLEACEELLKALKLARTPGFSPGPTVVYFVVDRFIARAEGRE